MTDRTPYTYLVGWSKLNKWYYGVRYRKGCHPSDFWIKYFTSSKVVKQFRKLYGEPDVIQIRKIFDDIDSARNWELKVLQKLNVTENSKWLNQTDSISIRLDNLSISSMASKLSIKYKGEGNPFYGKSHTKETRQKMSELGKQRDVSDAVKNMLKNKWVGKTRTEKNKENVSNYAKKRIWIVNKEGALSHCTDVNDLRLLSGEFKLGRKWSN